MKSKQNISIICCALACVVLSSKARAGGWGALYAFGDSYSDTGAGYVDGNGPTAVAYLAADLGIPFTYAGDPNSAGKSLNFAVSGAQTGKADGIHIRPATAECGRSEALFGRGMRTQVVEFSQRVKSGALKFNPQQTLFFLAGGLNDNDLPTATTVQNMENEVRLLYELGGRYFMVALLPTKIPEFTQVGSRLNPAIAKIPAELQSALAGAHIAVSHWGEYFDRVVEKPTEYGITNTVDRCAGRAVFGEDPTPCTSPDTHFYFHEGHPSTAVQRIVASKLKREINELFPQ
jgi:phospholipase/lecithinase/hemolysin